MGLGTTTWLQATPVILVATALFFLPGAFAARLLGCGWAAALAVGPALTTTAIAAGGIVAGAFHIAWGAPALGATILLTVAVAGALGRWVGRVPSDPVDDGLGEVLAGVAVGLVGVALVLIPASGSAAAFPQHPDTIYHLGTIRWMLERGDISTLHAAGFSSVSGSGFYPAAFHGLAATVALLTGASPVVAASTTAFTTAGLIWPAAVIWLARQILGPGLGVCLAAGVASVTFTAFPFWLLGYGVLWPNLLGQALLPAVIAILLIFARGRDRLRHGLLAIGALPGLAMAHPNAVVALGLLGGLALLWAGLSAAWASRDSPRHAATMLALCVGGSVAAGALWVAGTLRSAGMRASGPRGPEMSLKDGLLDAALFGPRATPALWLAGAAVLAGVGVLLVRRTHWWVIAGHALISGLYVLNVAVDSRATRLLTWPWYNNSPRLAALAVVTAALLATTSLDALGRAVAAVARRGSLRSRRLALEAVEHPGILSRYALVIGAATIPAVFLVATGGGYVNPHRQVLEGYFRPRSQNAWASPSELNALTKLSREIPPGQVVAANPWKGASYLYLVSGRHMLFATEKAWAPGDRALLGTHLADAGTDGAVCAAARRQRVSYAITGGISVGGIEHQPKRYAGVDSVGESKAFTLVAEASPYRLYRLVSCAGVA